ncbi:MAG: hypothetical protein V7K40_07515 [Nostoc sp.]
MFPFKSPKLLCACTVRLSWIPDRDGGNDNTVSATVLGSPRRSAIAIATHQAVINP